MQVRSLALAVGLTVGCSAFAMPAVDGTYTCKAGSQQAQIKLVTRNNQLFLEGLDTGSAGLNDNGLPCGNENQAQEMNGMSVKLAATCDDKAVSVSVGLKMDSQDTDFLTSVSVTRLSDSNVAISVKVAGKLAGQQANEIMSLDCQK